MLINKTQGTENVYKAADYTNESTAKVKEEVKTKEPSATLELGAKKEEEATYKKPTTGKVDRGTVNRMIDESNRRMENFKNLIRTLIEKQGGTVEAALSGNFKLEIDEATRLEAQEAISEDGEFGVAKTAGRIVDFAKAISGGDVSKLDTLKKAIKQGFDEAEKILGELPDISKETYKEVMRQLDEWAAGASESE